MTEKEYEIRTQLLLTKSNMELCIEMSEAGDPLIPKYMEIRRKAMIIIKHLDDLESDRI